MRAFLAAFSLLFSSHALAAGTPTRVGTAEVDAPAPEAAPRKVATTPKRAKVATPARGGKVQPKGGVRTRAAGAIQPKASQGRPPVVVAGHPGPKAGGAGRPPVVVVGHPGVQAPVAPGLVGNPVRGPIRHGGPRHVVAGTVSPLHGIFIYGPRPGTHDAYTGQDEKIARRDMPDRSLDRGGSLAVGLLGGAVFSSEADGSAVFGDPGAGLQARFRPVEFLGIQVAAEHTVGWLGVDPGAPLRESTMGTASLQLFAFPWSHVSPFVSAGATLRDSDMTVLGAASGKDSPLLWGPHAGLGLEIGIGKSVAIDLDGGLDYLVNAAANGATPASFTTNAGLLFHF